MPGFLTMILSNAVLATLLALAAACAGRLCHRPALVHGLWLLVLIKLITPPLVPISIHVPEAIASRATPSSTDATAIDGLADVTTDLSPAQTTEEAEAPVAAMDAGVATTAYLSFDWRVALLAVWLGGSLLWWGLALFRLGRFHKYLRFAGSATPEVQFRITLLAQRLGLRIVPDVLFTNSALSPLLWFCGGRPRLVVAEELWEQLTEPQRDALLVHELAHLRRGDHWVRLLELIVLGLYWWHPVAWWAQRELREVEEYCCDAWVVWALPESAATYAATLVETLTFLSRARGTLPLAASGIGAMPIARRRLTMILREAPPRMLSRTGLMALLVLGMLLLPFWPTWAQPPQPSARVEDQATSEAADAPAENPAPRNRPNQGEGAGAPRNNEFDPNQFFNIIANGKDVASRADIADPRLQAMFDRFVKPLGVTNGQITREQFVSAMQPRIGQRSPGTPMNGMVSNEEIESARDEVELAKAHLHIQRAQLAAAEASLKLEAQQRERIKNLSGKGAVSQEDVAQAESRVEMMALQVEIKRAELREPEVRLHQAERRMVHITQLSGYEPYQTRRGRREPAANTETDRRNVPAEPANPAERRNSVFNSGDPTGAHLRDLDSKLEAIMTQLEALRREIQGIQRPRDANAPKP